MQQTAGCVLSIGPGGGYTGISRAVMGRSNKGPGDCSFGTVGPIQGSCWAVMRRENDRSHVYTAQGSERPSHPVSGTKIYCFRQSKWLGGCTALSTVAQRIKSTADTWRLNQVTRYLLRHVLLETSSIASNARVRERTPAHAFEVLTYLCIETLEISWFSVWLALELGAAAVAEDLPREPDQALRQAETANAHRIVGRIRPRSANHSEKTCASNMIIWTPLEIEDFDLDLPLPNKTRERRLLSANTLLATVQDLPP
ncbi:hypothetical protein FB451DRAFT_1378053 [Mycena latifolia]|nr:hypothetical protein FB451DRAFT_1378053 [Mycena latifolia]